MSTFNLSDWALKHRSLVWYLLLTSLVAGAFAYVSMGREEDPAFTIKTMIVSGILPGATAEQTAIQVTDRIERKLLELDTLKATRSVTTPGQTTVYIDLRDDTPEAEVGPTWLRVRNMMSDIRREFPQEFAGFVFNDNFGDVFGNIYAFTSDGFSPRELRDHVDQVRMRVEALSQVGKVELLGTREEAIYIEFSNRRLAALGLDRQQVFQSLAAQNAIVPSGVIDTEQERVLVRVSGDIESAEALAAINLRSGDTYFALSDVADVKAAYVDPPASLFRYKGEPAIGLMIGMRKGGNILDLGEELSTLMAETAATLPIGIELHQVANQPEVVKSSIGLFIKALIEAIVIILVVSFISLGLKAGFVVALTIPLVLAMSFAVLYMMDITLQRISLGALIISLGLLVDDAMIAIETMISRLEKGESKDKAASYAWTSVAFPMLTGTLITIAGFIPIGLNSSQAGEFTYSLFVVIAVTLTLSWVVAVLFAPVLGVALLPSNYEHHEEKAGFGRRMFHGLLRTAMRFRWTTIFLTAAMFGASLYGMQFVEQQFFPTSDRTELIVDVNLRQNAAFASTDETIKKVETYLADQDEARFWSSYVGAGTPRFVLSIDVPAPSPNFGQIIIQTKDVEARDRLQAKLQAFGRREIPKAELFVKLVELGPPVGKPVQYRITGPDVELLRDKARDLAAVLAHEERLSAVGLDWNEPSRVATVQLDQDKLRQLNLTQQDVAQTLRGIFDGTTVTQIRDDRYLVDVISRGAAADRGSLEALTNLQFGTPAGVAIPLASFASITWGTEQALIRRRNGEATITVKAAINNGDQPATLVAALDERIEAFRQTLPPFYKVEVGGTVETSAESQEPIFAVVPIMLLIMITLIMVQMQSFRLTFIVLAVAPLVTIGVVLALLPSGAPLGFVAILGVLALIGILIRNSIILVDEIQTLLAKGRDRWTAVFEASDSRARPIMLTAAAGSLALIPISRQIFWGPMAYAMMGGIIVGTIITLLFIPALYCAVFGVRPPKNDTSPDDDARDAGAETIEATPKGA